MYGTMILGSIDFVFLAIIQREYVVDIKNCNQTLIVAMTRRGTIFKSFELFTDI